MSQMSASRRRFPETLSCCGGYDGGVAAGSVVRHAHAAADNTLKIALIGCGGRGTGAVNDCLNAAKILKQPMKLVAVADAFEERVRNSLRHIQQEWEGERGCAGRSRICRPGCVSESD